MSQVSSLPKIMVAPNGARRGKSDHSALPITIDEIVETAIDCQYAGADGLHLHVRDKHGNHTLDVSLYHQALCELETVLPGFFVQITTESVGLYSPSQQRDVVQKVKPRAVSIAISEMLSDGNTQAAIRFYRWCLNEKIAVQHIVYGVEDLDLIEHYVPNLTSSSLQLLFVLGRYTQHQKSVPEHLNPFFNWLTKNVPEADWAVCAFGQKETDCLLKAYRLGGKIRTGFENSIWNRNGLMAKNNAERVGEICRLIRAESRI